MLLIAGLGNPGGHYASHRHNIGFMAVDAIARRHGFSSWTKKFQGLVATGDLCGERALLLKPQTYMNLSGQAVGEALRYHRLGTGDLIVVHDELDLALGKVRLKTGGGSGGHNGIKSIDAHCGKEYRRVRVGIGHPGARELVDSHVLGNFAVADREWLAPLLEAFAEHACLLAARDDAGFMNRMSPFMPKPSAPRAAAAEPPAPNASAAPTGRSHIRQARPRKPEVKIPETGPMAAMLKRLFGSRE